MHQPGAPCSDFFTSHVSLVSISLVSHHHPILSTSADTDYLPNAPSQIPPLPSHSLCHSSQSKTQEMEIQSFHSPNKAPQWFPVAMGVEWFQSLPWLTKPKRPSNWVLQTHWAPEPLISLLFLSAQAPAYSGASHIPFPPLLLLFQLFIPIHPSSQTSNVNSLAKFFSPFLVDQGMSPCYSW